MQKKANFAVAYDKMMLLNSKFCFFAGVVVYSYNKYFCYTRNVAVTDEEVVCCCCYDRYSLVVME